MTPAEFAEALRVLVGRLVAEGELEVAVPASVPVRPAPTADHSCYSTPLALQLAHSAGRPAGEVAEMLADRLRREPALTGVEVAGPGFLQIRLPAESFGETIRTIVRAARAGRDLHCRTGASDRLHGPEASDAANCCDLSAAVAGALHRRKVALTRSGVPVSAPDQAGDSIMEDLAAVVGEDAARYAIIRAPADRVVTVDLDLMLRRTRRNPLFRVQYAHARACSLLRNAAELGLAVDVEGADLSLPTHPRERDLLQVLGELPSVVGSVTRAGAPVRVTRHLEDLAGACDRFCCVCPVLPRGDEQGDGLTAARLVLVEAIRVVVDSGLRLLGVSAPTRM